jgi:hypothetical protein
MADKKHLSVPHHNPANGESKKTVRGTPKGGIKSKTALKGVRKVAPRPAKVKKA